MMTEKTTEATNNLLGYQQYVVGDPWEFSWSYINGLHGVIGNDRPHAAAGTVNCEAWTSCYPYFLTHPNIFSILNQTLIFLLYYKEILCSLKEKCNLRLLLFYSRGTVFKVILLFLSCLLWLKVHLGGIERINESGACHLWCRWIWSQPYFCLSEPLLAWHASTSCFNIKVKWTFCRYVLCSKKTF